MCKISKILILFFFLTFLWPTNAWALKHCQDCHDVRLDEKHQFACTECHRGRDPARGARQAHKDLRRYPASPQLMKTTCGRCHPQEVEEITSSLHYTLAGEVNQVREIFGLSPVSQAVDLPVPQQIKSLDDLVSDLLRRRCLRCHLFYAGDDYSETRRGVGCAACHLRFAQGHLEDHRFVKDPPDRNCLHCHYGNRVGWDYYGMFEHDYPYQFRSPFIDGHLPPRPWGVEFHELTPDVHLKHGMSCLACHTKAEVMGDGHYYAKESQAVKVRCTNCHKVADASRAFHNPKVLSKARCSTCHALWSFQDKGWHLMLQEDPDWDDWSEFLVQGSSEIETLVREYLKTGRATPEMTDKFTGHSRPGVWFLGFSERRFEDLPLGFDSQGKLAVVRPILDLHLSYVTADGEVLFDDYVPLAIRQSPERAYVPYVPHTIGPADTFRSLEVLKKLGLLRELLGGKGALPRR